MWPAFSNYVYSDTGTCQNRSSGITQDHIAQITIAINGNKLYSESCLERPHVRAVDQCSWSLTRGNEMIYKGLVIQIIFFFI